MYVLTKTQRDRTNLWINKSTPRTLTEDELIEASIRQRVRALENNLFDEYGDELLTAEGGHSQALDFQAREQVPTNSE